MRIMIVGAGAIGGFLASQLHEGGHEVCIIARGSHLDAIRRKGLCLRHHDSSEKTIQIPASEAPETLGSQDLVITTVKAPALPDILPNIRSVVDDKTPIITAMNGVFWWYGHGLDVSGTAPDTSRLDPDNRISKMLPIDQAMGVVIHSTNQVVEPGIIQNRSKKNKFILGSAAPDTNSLVQKLAADLTVSGVRFEADNDVRRAMWRKLLRNLSTAPSSVLTNGQAYDIINDDNTENVARSLFLEGAAVAAAHGFSGLDEEVEQVFKPGSGARQKPSMCQDYDLRRPMEIDNILRIVQDFARQCDIPTPTLDTVVALVILRARLAGCYPDPK